MKRTDKKNTSPSKDNKEQMKNSRQEEPLSPTHRYEDIHPQDRQKDKDLFNQANKVGRDNQEEEAAE